VELLAEGALLEGGDGLVDVELLVPAPRPRAGGGRARAQTPGGGALGPLDGELEPPAAVEDVVRERAAPRYREPVGLAAAVAARPEVAAAPEVVDRGRLRRRPRARGPRRRRRRRRGGGGVDEAARGEEVGLGDVEGGGAVEREGGERGMRGEQAGELGRVEDGDVGRGGRKLQVPVGKLGGTRRDDAGGRDLTRFRAARSRSSASAVARRATTPGTWCASTRNGGRFGRSTRSAASTSLGTSTPSKKASAAAAAAAAS